MSKTKIQIEIDEDQFRSLIEKEITDLPKDQIQKILLESIRSYLEGDSTIKIEEVRKNEYGATIYPVETNRKNYDKLNALLIKKEDFYRGTNYEASNLLINLLKECDFSGLQEIVDNMIKDLKDNYHDILVEILSKQLVGSMINTYEFGNKVTDIVISELNNPNREKY